VEGCAEGKDDPGVGEPVEGSATLATADTFDLILARGTGELVISLSRPFRGIRGEDVADAVPGFVKLE
jgi:hypothetical protein